MISGDGSRDSITLKFSCGTIITIRDGMAPTCALKIRESISRFTYGMLPENQVKVVSLVDEYVVYSISFIVQDLMLYPQTCSI